MKSALSVGADGAPEAQIENQASQAVAGKARRIAGLSAAAAVIVGVGAASALFVDYLADRAMARSAEPVVVVKPVVADTVDITSEHKVTAASLTAAEKAIPTAIPAAAPAEPAPATAAPPEPAPILATLPDAAAIAKVAVGPEHAVELPTEDPTANPVLAKAKSAAADEAAQAAVEDETITAAISPDEDEPAAPVKKARTAEAKPAAKQPQQVASLPGVEGGELTDSAGASAAETATGQPAAKNLGGVPAGPARVTSAVKLRSGPGKGSGVLGVVPAGSVVNVMTCNGWCQIDHGGQKGWIYKNFLAAAKQLPPPTQPGQTAQDAPEKRPGQSSRL